MTLITAHSGCEGTPMNSMAHIMAAIDSGADYIEVDVLPTKDGVAVLSHDDYLNGKPITETLYEDIKGELVEFKEAIDLIMKSGKKINIDIKDVQCVPYFAPYIIEKGYKDRVLLSGCLDEDLVYLKEHYPWLPKLYNCYLLLDDPDMSDNDIKRRLRFFGNQYKDEVSKRAHIEEMIKEHVVEGLNISYKQATEERMAWAKGLNIPIFVWTADEEKDMLQNVLRGVTSITTNNVSLCRSVINKEQS